MEVRFSYLFASTLHERLVWFGRLRWLACAGLATASMVGPRIGLAATWPSLFVIATFVAMYNLLFQRRLRAHKDAGRSYEALRRDAIYLMVLDLTALMVAVHFTGGMTSPLLPFFAFHMAIGTIMISSWIMYLLAAATCVGAFTLYILETRGVLESYAIVPLEQVGGNGSEINLLVLAVATIGIVYLTDSVTSRFKQRNIELHQTTVKLRERTDELQNLLQEIEDLERRKSHYMRISAHQLRSPLGTVRTSLQVLADGYADPNSDRGRKLLRGAVERVDGLLAIVNDLLDLAKIREGRSRATWKRQININQLLADLFDSMEPYAEDRKVELVPEFDGVAVLDWGIPPDLVHAFENLIHNAIKYSHSDSRVAVQLRTPGDVAMVRVVDEGIGVPPEFVDQVFLEFVRAPSGKHHAPEGTGLGLPIVKEVAEAHGGRVSLSSREGEGSTFTVTLPLHYSPPVV
jgi:signal transduction histidine kinase